MQQGATGQLDIRIVVLVGGRDFGRCPLATGLPVALWPIRDRPALLRLLDHLAAEGITEATVCCGRDVRDLVQAVCTQSRLKTTLLVEELTSGTAGCLRDAAASRPGDLLLAFSGSMMAPPPLAGLIQAHHAGGAELSIVFNPARDHGSPLGPAAEIWLCQPTALRYIPGGGYSDIKEGLVPALLRAGGTVHPIVLERDVGNFRDRTGYLNALAWMESHAEQEGQASVAGQAEEPCVRHGVGVVVHPTARICGPVVLGDNVKLAEGTVVMGPALIGQDVVVGENSVVVRSALWAKAAVGARCEIRESIVDTGARLRAGARAVGQTVSVALSDRWLENQRAWLRAVGHRIESDFDRVARHLPPWAPWSARQLEYLLGGLLVFLAFLWSYWPTLTDLVQVWLGSDEYSSGLLVPPLALYVIWSRREDFAAVKPRPAVFWGVVAFLAAQGMRAAGLAGVYQSAERLSLMFSLAALVLLLLGWKYLRQLASILVFLCLMLPWPNRIQTAVTLPLQSWSTSSAVFCLELAGYEVVQDGNVIHIGDASVAVAEACNGLRMITAFFVISGLVVLLVKRAWWEKLIVLVSSLPIALLCNTLRLAVTALVFTVVKGEVWEQRFHDWGGYAMMPLALALVVGELWVLTQLTTPPTETKPVVISRRRAQHVSDS